LGDGHTATGGDDRPIKGHQRGRLTLKLAGFGIKDTRGNGVQGSIPLTGVTLLFGKNASGKTTFLESLASFLDPKSEWLGRRA
jgi:translation initiation factor RLI1